MARSPIRVFGHIHGIPVGSRYPDRESLAVAGVHKPTQAGISYSEKEGADSIVASGGYEDGVGCGDVLIYTGMGGERSVVEKAD